MTEDYLQQLNGQQRAAVEYVDGPSLVIAGAGSGKTRVLTYKIVHLLRCGYEPWRILALTFTNKAAREMRERIEALVGTEVASRLWMGTFHSIFARILRANADRIGFKSSFTIYDSADSKSLVKTIVKDLVLDEKIYKPSSVISAISTAKNALISPEKYAADREIMRADADARRPRIHEIYRIYRDRCFTAGAMDFDDLLYYTNVLLRDNPDVLRHYQEFFRYVLVDEYQDTNFAQHLIVAKICEEHHQLCVVGDDAQSIYSFRGANIRNILSMRDTYPGMKLFKLERNYRSTQNIINAANSLIEKNTEQIRKEVYSENKPGDRIEVVSSYSDLDESAIVANRISQVRMLTHDSYDEFAILYRTNAQSRILEESLRKRNIPYRIYGGLSFYQRKEVKDAVAYFRLAVNPDDDEALRRVINFPARGIGETTVNKVARTAMDSGVSMMAVLHDPDGFGLEVHSGTRRKLAAFASMVDRFAAQVASGDDALAVASEIIRATGLLSMLITDRTPESISKQENLNELLAGVKEFTEMRREEGEAELGLASFLGQISLATDQDSDDATEERVTLMTVHAAKGLEFNNVFIVGVEEDLFPSSMAQGSQSEIEEERRLLYVAITRARSFCMMSFASNRYRNGQPAMCSPSRFLHDIDPCYLAMKAGATIGAPRSRRPSYSDYMAAARQIRYPARQAQASQPTASSVHRDPVPASASAAKGETSFATMPGADGSRLKAGMVIEHNRFGRGIIIEVDTSQPDHRIKVDFDNSGEKLLLLKFAKFIIID